MPVKEIANQGSVVRNSSHANTVSQSLQFTRLCRRTAPPLNLRRQVGISFSVVVLLVTIPLDGVDCAAGCGFSCHFSLCHSRNPCEKLNLAVLVFMSARGIR